MFWIFFVSYYNLVSPAAKDAEIAEYVQRQLEAEGRYEDVEPKHESKIGKKPKSEATSRAKKDEDGVARTVQMARC